MNLDSIPATLRESGLFCCWQYEKRGGRPTKVPYNPKTGNRAQSTNPATFAPLSEALKAVGGYDGIGVGVFGDLGAIDIDHCISDNGELSEMAVDIMDTMQAYTERSPSGHGLRILFTVPPGFEYDRPRHYIKHPKNGLEVYIAGSTNKYVTVTGDTLTPGHDLEERGEQLAAVLEKYMVRPRIRNQKPTPPLTPADRDLIGRAKRSKRGAEFSALWGGDGGAYESPSEADMALCNMLAFWTNRNPAQMDRLFRNSGLMRSKWDEIHGPDTYGAITIQNAIDTATEGYGDKSAKPPIVQHLEVISARDLQKANLPPVKYLVDGMLPEGTTLLTAASKIGKSWMVLHLALCIAAGEPFMGHKVTQCGVLYLALEDSLNRLQDRMNKILQGKPAPEHFYFSTKAPDMDHGLLEMLDEHLTQHPETKLIIIDTLQKVRGQAISSKEHQYAQEYREMGNVKAYMGEKGVSVVFVHHNRKMKDDDDPFNMISGTNALMGAADTIWTITKAKRDSAEATLHITGRDVFQSDTVITFNQDTGTWKAIGSEADVAAEAEWAKYHINPIVKTIKALLEQSPEKRWDGPMKDLLEAGKVISETLLAPNAQQLGYAVRDLEPGLLKYDNIIHWAPSNGTGGKRHYFYYRKPDTNNEQKNS
ncbi:phage NrS-1 polymerase family protein [Anaerotruncus colihominis]|uniref:phage NrS-1 polymerase family protein n=1 Tax=Anaerotruncus colihominis TaxID=169435 RepID=UPI0026716A20|nr:AAA family ATPase [Anaerotruncus colihominis]